MKQISPTGARHHKMTFFLNRVMLVIPIGSGHGIDRVTQAYIDSQDFLHLLHQLFFRSSSSWEPIVMSKRQIGLTYDVSKERGCGNKQVTTPTSNPGTGAVAFTKKLRVCGRVIRYDAMGATTSIMNPDAARNGR